jgi:hypothetical protein
MNTKIAVQRLANIVHSRTNETLALIKMDSGTLHSIKLGLATVVLFCAKAGSVPAAAVLRLTFARACTYESSK